MSGLDGAGQGPGSDSARSLPQASIAQVPQQGGPTSSQAQRELPQLPRNLYAVRNGKDHEHKNRTIVICLDGTGDKFDDDNSNIVHLVSCLKKADPSQLIYYQSGIGTYDGGGLSNGINAALDMAVGSGLGVHVRDAYKYLMQNYHQGDKICLFGFSRGAYTARCLGGMVHKVGLLPAHNVSQIPFAYEYYKDDSEKGYKMSEDFKRTFCMDVNIYFIGVFDSVASVGFIPRKLPLSATPVNKAVYFRHAMAMDERRAKFKTCRFRAKTSIRQESWDVVVEKQESNKLDTSQRLANGNSISTLGANDHQRVGNGIDSRPDTAHRITKRNEETDVLEVWFAGAHCDVGGGAVPNEQRHKLSQIPLRWMIRQCFECDTGIIFKSHRLAEEGIDVQTLWPKYTPTTRPTEAETSDLRQRFLENKQIPSIRQRSAALTPVDEHHPQGPYYLNVWQDGKQQETINAWVPEQAEDLFDAVQPLKDQLAIKRVWWILEITPIKVRIQPQDSDEWEKKVRMNLGRYRCAQEKAPNMHWTVEERMRSDGYQIKLRKGRNAEWQIVV